MSQKQNPGCSDLFESAANEAKRLKWIQDISAAQFELKRIEDERIENERRIKEKKYAVVYKLAETLEEHEMPIEFILETVSKSLDGYGITYDYVRKLLKKIDKFEALEESTVEIPENPKILEFDDNNPSGQSTVTVGGGEPEEEPEEQLPPTKAVKKLKEKLETTVQELEKEMERVAFLEQSQPVEDIPQVVDNKIGPIKTQNLSKISQFDKRGYQILASRFGEVVRRKIISEGKVGIRFYIISKDRTTNIEYMVPVLFTVNMVGRTTELVLDESRL
jgi:hypothetical protein